MTDYIKEIYSAVLNYDIDLVKKLVSEALDSGIDPNKVMNEALSKSIIEIGEKFGREEIFLVELMVASDACKIGMDIVKKGMLDIKMEAKKSRGVIVLGTVKGDIHNIGKDIVKTLLEITGFEIHDIGVDQAAENFVKKAVKVNAKIIGSSALLTTTSPNQREIEKELASSGLKGKIKTIIGGAATNAEWAREIGADFYASTAIEGVSIIKKYFEGDGNEI